MKNNEMPSWLDELITAESKEISKQADEASEDSSDKPMTLEEIEKAIDEAKTPEELDKLEEQLNKLDDASAQKQDQQSSENDSSDDEESDSSEGSSVDDSNSDDDSSSKSDGDLVNEVAGLKKEIKDEKDDIQKKLLEQITKLNDSMGANKVVDLNRTIDLG